MTNRCREDWTWPRGCRVAVLLALALPASGCGVISLAGSVAGAVVDVGAAVVTTGVKAVGAVIPDGEDEDKDKAPVAAVD